MSAAGQEHLVADKAGGLLWEPAAETLPTPELGELQLRRLRATLQNAYDNVPFYRKRLDEAGIEPGDVGCHGDVADLPFTTKIDLRDHYPFGMFARPRPRSSACTPPRARRATPPRWAIRATTSRCGASSSRAR